MKVRTLPYFIHKSTQRFKNEIFIKIGKDKFTYSQIDILTDDLAAHFRNQKLHETSFLYIEKSNKIDYIITTLSAIKAGLIIVDSVNPSNFLKDDMPLKREIIIYKDGYFRLGSRKESFKNALKVGSKFLLFLIPEIQIEDTVFMSTQKNLYNNGKLNHQSASELIFNINKETEINNYVIFLMHLWVNNLKFK